MKVFVCVDNAFGMAFNRRRQSRDRILNEDVIKTAQTRLLCTSYSEPLLCAHPHLLVSEDPLADATETDFVFVEKTYLSCAFDRIDTLILYHWHRDYPSDMKFDLNLSDFHLVSTEDLVGYSHDKITKEIYTK